MRIRWQPGRAAACAALTLAGAHGAQAEVVVDQAFAGGVGPWRAEGSVTTVSAGARLRGGSNPGRLTSAPIDVRGLQRLRVTVERSASGLDAGEAATLVATVDGQARTLEAQRSPSGSATFALDGPATTLTLSYALTASSLLETATLTRVRVEGDRDDVPPVRTGTLVPDASWTCGLPNGIPDPAGGTLVFRTALAADAPLDLGRTPEGERRVIRTAGGALSGGSAGGNVLPGSLEFDLRLPSGAVEHEARHTLRMSDGTLVYARHCGVADGADVRFVARFEAPSSSRWQWLNSGTYVGRRQAGAGGVTWSVHAVSATPDPADPVTRVPADPGLPQQPFDCPAIPAGATRGDTALLTARVAIGSSQAVGTTPAGRRNIIPITGGSVTGTLASGTVNPGGADHQLTVGGELQIEARYTLRTNDGELIAVRNCGDFGVSDLTAVTFEARADGPYAGLNGRTWAGTITPGLGNVTIRVYERR